MLITIVSVAALVAIDQLTKYLATLYLAPVGTLPFLPGVMQLQYVLNDGAAFSMFSGARTFLVVITGVALLALAVYLFWKKPHNPFEYWAWVLILAGGLGNFVDRVLNGVVVDFFAVTFMNFAVFNVADCFVCVGVFVLFITVVVQEVQAAKRAKQAAAEKQAALAQPEDANGTP